MAELPTETRNWAMMSHLGAALLAMTTASSLGFLGPLIVLVVKQDDKIVQWHAYQSLFFQLGLMLVAWGSAASCFLAPLSLIAWLASIILPIIAAVRVNNDEDWDGYPITSGLVPKRLE